MARGCWIGHVNVTDPDRCPEYLGADPLAFEKFKAWFPVRGGKNKGLESTGYAGSLSAGGATSTTTIPVFCCVST